MGRLRLRRALRLRQLARTYSRAGSKACGVITHASSQTGSSMRERARKVVVKSAEVAWVMVRGRGRAWG